MERKDLPYLDAVSVSFISSRLSAFIEFTQGKLDFIGDLDNSYKDEILSLDGEIKEPYKSAYTFLLAPQLNTEYLAFQTRPKAGNHSWTSTFRCKGEKSPELCN